LHVVGLCQAGWVSALAATHNELSFGTLTLAGTPIDTSFESIITPAQKVPFFFYQAAVIKGGGLMRGAQMLEWWRSGKESEHASMEKLPESKRFYEWYNAPQDLAAKWYLWAVRTIFINNDLLEMLSLRMPVNCVVAEEDDITPPDQTLAVQHRCSHMCKVYRAKGGHIGLFMSKAAIKETWPRVFQGTNL